MNGTMDAITEVNGSTIAFVFCTSTTDREADLTNRFTSSINLIDEGTAVPKRLTFTNISAHDLFKTLKFTSSMALNSA